MATMKLRGYTYSVIYHYKGADGKDIQHWETYKTELEAIQRKTHIDYLQKNKDNDAIMKQALEYKQMRAALAPTPTNAETKIVEQMKQEDNLSKTLAEFVEKWVPMHTRKQRLQPNSYEGLTNNLRVHILPYFGKRIMSSITALEVDEFLDYLSEKKCRGSKSFNKNPEDIPSLSSATVRKIYNILFSAFAAAKDWGYITEIPKTKAPTVKSKKRGYWLPDQVQAALKEMDDKLLRLAVHTTFMCSLRPGETMGIEIKAIDFTEGSLWITQTLQRVSDEALSIIPPMEIKKIFPKVTDDANSQLVLKTPKTEGSERKVYLPESLLDEIRKRIEQIQKNKDFFGDEYHDNGLLFSQPNGFPIETTLMEKWFRNWQKGNAVEPMIDIQGLRKSGQMYKIRLSGHDYQTVASGGGHSTAVLMTNYDEPLEKEKKKLASKLQDDFYEKPKEAEKPNLQKLLETIARNPQMAEQLTALLQNMQ